MSDTIRRQIQAFGAQSPKDKLAPITITRRNPTDKDVVIEILYCGVCHSDLHQSRDEWKGSLYPVIPGHEIVGRVSAVGSQVTKFAPGDVAAVGCMVDSCRRCASCLRGLEQYCSEGATWTYNSPDRHLGGHTFGGYSQTITVDEDYVLGVPPNMDLAATAPLLCAGITTWSPLHHWKVGPKSKVGIIGLGGLGHMAVKFARALGADVTLITTSPHKADDGLKLGAHQVILSTDSSAMASAKESFDFILDCVSANHDIDAYLKLLRLDGTLVLVGVPDAPLAVNAFTLMLPRKQFAGSGIGSIAETQEMLNFCALHQVKSEIELIRMEQINEAFNRLEKGDVRYRFVIDMSTSWK